MIRIILNVFWVLLYLNVYAQKRIVYSVTGIMDKSYDLSAAYSKTKKYYAKTSYRLVESKLNSIAWF